MWRAGGSSSVGRALAFQAGCREFEPRLPLQSSGMGGPYARSLGDVAVWGCRLGDDREPAVRPASPARQLGINLVAPRIPAIKGVTGEELDPRSIAE